MSASNPVNKPASIRQRLLNHAKATRQDFQRIIDGYAIECVLHRLSQSAYGDRFLLKGALLFAVWKGLGKRPTRDLDLMGRGESDIDSIVRVFKEIVSIDMPEDGVGFLPGRMNGLRIKEDDEYEGVRVFVEGALDGALFKVQIDIGFGDAITPAPIRAKFPRMLEMPAFSLLTYPAETVFAEKLDAIVGRGMLNSRMKDYYDLSMLICDKMVTVDVVRQAVIKTFARRKRPLPESCPIGLTDEFANDTTKIAQWKGFLKKSGLDAGELSSAIASIRAFVEQVFEKW